jgi:hypothetical protein
MWLRKLICKHICSGLYSRTPNKEGIPMTDNNEGIITTHFGVTPEDGVEVNETEVQEETMVEPEYDTSDTPEEYDTPVEDTTASDEYPMDEYVQTIKEDTNATLLAKLDTLEIEVKELKTLLLSTLNTIATKEDLASLVTKQPEPEQSREVPEPQPRVERVQSEYTGTQTPAADSLPETSFVVN